jgi:hypothetical protein
MRAGVTDRYAARRFDVFGARLQYECMSLAIGLHDAMACSIATVVRDSSTGVMIWREQWAT